MKVVDTTKYLGLQIDNSLDWKYHVSFAVGFSKHAKSILHIETLNKLYAGIVEPHFHYCCSVWGCCGVTEKKTCRNCKTEPQELQQITALMLQAYLLVRKLGWKIIEELIAHESELMLFRSIHGLAPHYMSDLFTKISQLTCHKLRNIATGLWLPQKRSSNGLKSFSYRGVKTWNSFPTICKQAIATSDFKSDS